MLYPSIHRAIAHPSRPSAITIDRAHPHAIASQTKPTANNKKLNPAIVLSILGETRLASHLPAATPRKLVVTNAIAAPINTIRGDFDSAVIIKVVICVLSPISAKNTVKNVVVAIWRCSALIMGVGTDGLSGFDEDVTGLL
jgi:hypothetical protein